MNATHQSAIVTDDLVDRVTDNLIAYMLENPPTEPHTQQAFREDVRKAVRYALNEVME